MGTCGKGVRGGAGVYEGVGEGSSPAGGVGGGKWGLRVGVGRAGPALPCAGGGGVFEAVGQARPLRGSGAGSPSVKGRRGLLGRQRGRGSLCVKKHMPVHARSGGLCAWICEGFHISFGSSECIFFSVLLFVFLSFLS